MIDDTLTFGSLFAGIGGLDLGLERAGMKCKWQVEIDEYATRVLERHWPDVRRWRDITTFPPDTDSSGLAKREGIDQDNAAEQPTIERSDLFVDLISGGFPCQDISYSGRGAGLAGERSGLFFEAIRVVRQLRPRYVLLENVAALLTRGLDRVHGELASLGYDSESHCIQAAAVGAPHIRDRVFVIAYANSGGFQVSQKHLADPGRRNGEGQRREICRGPIPSGWEPEPDVDRVANGVPKRVDRLRGLGNAVVPQVAEWIGRKIMAND